MTHSVEDGVQNIYDHHCLKRDKYKKINRTDWYTKYFGVKCEEAWANYWSGDRSLRNAQAFRSVLPAKKTLRPRIEVTSMWDVREGFDGVAKPRNSV